LVGKAPHLVGKAPHFVLTIFLIITLFLGLNEPSIIEKAKKKAGVESLIRRDKPSWGSE